MILPFRNGEFRNSGFGCKDTTYFLPEKNRVTQYFKAQPIKRRLSGIVDQIKVYIFVEIKNGAIFGAVRRYENENKV
jgi:hypothetical protein